MTDDVTSRVLRLFERRLETAPEVSPATIDVLLNGQGTNDFGDDEELLDELLDVRDDE